MNSHETFCSTETCEYVPLYRHIPINTNDARIIKLVTWGSLFPNQPTKELPKGKKKKKKYSPPKSTNRTRTCQEGNYLITPKRKVPHLPSIHFSGVFDVVMLVLGRAGYSPLSFFPFHPCRMKSPIGWEFSVDSARPPSMRVTVSYPHQNVLCTLPETNMAPENRYLEKEIPIGNHHLKVPC